MKRTTKRATRARTTTRTRGTNAPARTIWLAGLGAVSSARERVEAAGATVAARAEALRDEAGRLVKSLRRDAARAGADAQKKASAYVRPLRQRAQRVAKDLEKGVAERVGALLGRFGVPSRADIVELTERVDALNKRIRTAPRRRTA
jgi:poly(hydroxyalkanoate) granule-associated protein